MSELKTKRSSQDLRTILGDAVSEAEIVTDPAEVTFLSCDVYRVGRKPIGVVRPQNYDSLINIVRTAIQHKLSIVVRGGGASYTDAFLVTDRSSLLIDTGSLIEITVDEQNGLVTVGPGVTWAMLKDALDNMGLRTPFWGPFSGIAATVAGSMSQNSLSHGSGVYGISAESVVSMELLTGTGEIIRTGSASAGTLPHSRHFGPDLTGLFTGDCGALGIKLKITMPVIKKREQFEALSFSFPNFAALHAGMRAAAQERLDDEHFAVDAALSQGQIAKEERAGRKAKMAFSVLKNANSLAGGLAQLARMGAAGDRALRESNFLCHFIIDGVSKSDASAKADRLRNILRETSEEQPNSVPTVVRGMPFAPLFNVLGPKGERWAPLHGIFAHEDVLPFHVEYDAHLEAHAEEMERMGVWTGAMFETIGSSGFLYEIAIYWPDEISVYHQRVIDDEYLSKLPRHARNEEASAYVENLRSDLIALYEKHNASHFQIGKAYPYLRRLEKGPRDLLLAIKHQLDPNGLMNPGALGL